MKYIYTAFLVFASMTAFSQAQGIIAISNGTTKFDYSGDLANVITNVAGPGDTIYLPGKLYFLNQGVTINKPSLVIIGAGYNLDSTFATTPTKIVIPASTYTFSIATGGDNVEIHGVHFSGGKVGFGSLFGIGTNVSNVLFVNCYFDNDFLMTFNPSFNSVATNTQFRNCIFNDYLGFGRASALIDNCILAGGYGYAQGNVLISNSVLLDPDLHYSNPTNSGIQYTNNIITHNTGSLAVQENSAFQNNLFVMPFPGNLTFPVGSSTGHLVETNINNVFINASLSTYSPNQDHYLVSGPYQTMGTFGQSVGIEDGNSPWLKGNLPFNPHWRSLFVPGSANAGLVQYLQLEASTKGSFTNALSGFRYWTDNSAVPSDMVNVAFPNPSKNLSFTDVLELCSFPVGAHQFHFQLRDSDGHWSSVICCKNINNDHQGPPPALTWVSNPQSVCAGDNEFYSVFPAGCSALSWTAPTGWSTPPVASNGYNATVGSTSGTITVTGSNTCGTTPTLSSTPTVGVAPTTLSWLTVPDSVCEGSVVPLSVNAPNSTSVNWTLPSGWSNVGTGGAVNPTASSTSGTITVQSSNNCGTSPSINSSVVVNLFPIEPNGINTGVNPIVDGISHTFTVVPNDPSLVYDWTYPSGWTNTLMSGGTFTATPDMANTVSVCVSATNSCGTSSDYCDANIVVQINVGVEEYSANDVLSVYPNPTHGFLVISFPNIESLKVFSTLGEELKIDRQYVGVNRITIDVSGLPLGAYYVTGISDSGRQSSSFIVAD